MSWLITKPLTFLECELWLFDFFNVLGWKSGVKEAASEVAEWHKSLVWVQELLVQVQRVRHCLHATPMQL